MSEKRQGVYVTGASGGSPTVKRQGIYVTGASGGGSPSGHDLPPGGTDGQFLVKNGSEDYSSRWQTGSPTSSTTETVTVSDKSQESMSGTATSQSAINKENKTAIAGKQSKIQYDVMPDPSGVAAGTVYQYIGADSSTFARGQFYECMKPSGEAAYWKEIFKGSEVKEYRNPELVPVNNIATWQIANPFGGTVINLWGRDVSTGENIVIDNAVKNDFITMTMNATENVPANTYVVFVSKM